MKSKVLRTVKRPLAVQRGTFAEADTVKVESRRKGANHLTRASRYQNKEMSMSQNHSHHLAQEFLGRFDSGAEPSEIANLFSENMEWEIAGDTGVLPWIAQKSGRAATTDFVNDSRAVIERISFEVHAFRQLRCLPGRTSLARLFLAGAEIRLAKSHPDL
jgi:hypothetical protein